MATITKDVYTHSGLAPLPLVINSLYASEMGFRLAFELLNDSNQVIYKGSLSPDMNGDMTIDLLPILKYYVKPHEFNDMGGIANASDEVFKYKYRTQESYIVSSLATDWLYVSPWANENKTVIEFDIAHHFTIADVGTYISIAVSNTYPDGSVQQSLSGNWILTDIISTDRIAIALPFPGSGLGFSALVYSASQIRTTRPAVTSSTKYLYNYTLTYEEQMNCATKDNNLLSFLSTSNSVKLLSSHIYPAPRDLYQWQNEYVTILDPNGAINKVRFTSDNCVLEKTVGVFEYKSIKISNLVDTEYTLVSGNLPLIDCNTKHYDVEFLNGANQVLNVDYLNSCNSTFQIGNYDCINAIQSVDNVIEIDIQVPTGTTVAVPSPFTLSLDGTLYSQSVVIDDEVILYLNLNSDDIGSYLETITFKNGWHMECRCICGTVDYSDEIVVEFDDTWDGLFQLEEGGTIPFPLVRPFKTRNLINDVTFTVDNPSFEISLDGINWSSIVTIPQNQDDGVLYIQLIDILQDESGTLTIESQDMGTEVFLLESQIIETTITFSPSVVTYVATEGQIAPKMLVTFSKNNNNGDTVFTIDGNYLISSTIDGTYTSSFTSNLQSGNIYVKMTDTATIGNFDATLNGESLSASEDLIVDGSVTSGLQAEFIVPGLTTGPFQSYVISVTDMSDLNSADAIQLPNGTSVRADNLMYCNGKWFAADTSLDGNISRLWISVNGAQTWSYVMDIDGKILNIYFINDEYVMYVNETIGNDKYVSSDGLTWIGSSLGSNYIIATKYKDNKLVLIFSNGIFKSLDGGVTWTALTNPITTPIFSYTKIYIDWDGDCWFMLYNNITYKSLDDGVTWGTKTSSTALNFAKLLPNGQFIVCGAGKILVTNKTTNPITWTTVNIANGDWVDVATNGSTIILIGSYNNNTATANTMARTTNMMATSGWVIASDNTIMKTGVIKSYNSQYIMITTLADNTRVLRRSDDSISWFDYTITPNVPLVGGNNKTNQLQVNLIEFRP